MSAVGHQRTPIILRTSKPGNESVRQRRHESGMLQVATHLLAYCIARRQADRYLILRSGKRGSTSTNSSDLTMCRVPSLYLRKCELFTCCS